MPAADDHPTIHRHGAVREPRDSDLRYKRYMRRRRIGSADRNGDPLDGLANLFLLAIVLAVGLLVAVLTSAGLSGLLTEKNMTIVTDPGTPQMQVIVKQGGKIEAVDMSATARQQGLGSLVGSFTDWPTAPSCTCRPTATPPGATILPEATPSPYPTTNPYASPTPSPAASPSSSPGAVSPAGEVGAPAPSVTPTPGATTGPSLPR